MWRKGFAEADQIFEDDYIVPKVQQAHIEPHVAISYWDEDDRLVIRTSTQVPFHVRRQLAPVLGLPIKRIRVIKPRIGGGFGGKQEVLIEDVVAHLTIATGRPVWLEYTREEEFIAARSRHPMRIHLKTGVKKDGTITANEMVALADTGAYGCHAVTVTGNTGQKPWLCTSVMASIVNPRIFVFMLTLFILIILLLVLFAAMVFHRAFGLSNATWKRFPGHFAWIRSNFV